jgi:hypothetical protein
MASYPEAVGLDLPTLRREPGERQLFPANAAEVASV